jgi:VWFA-related protein
MKTLTGRNIHNPIALLLLVTVCFTPHYGWSGQSSSTSNFPEAAAPQAGDDSGKIPTFKNRTEVVLVPVVVRDQHGKHVAGLTKEVFHLDENGKEQKISSFEEVVRAGTAPTITPDTGYSNLPLDASQHAHVTIAVIDLINTDELQRTDAKDQLIRFFSKDMVAGELVSLLCLASHGVKLVHPFTSDAALLVESLRQLKIEHVTLGNRRDIVHQTLKQLQEIAAAYAGVPGRKTLIWAAGNMEYPLGPNSAFGDLQLEVRNDYEETWAAMLSANIAVYPFGPLFGALDRSLNHGTVLAQEQTLRLFADRTGGVMCEEVNGLKDCFNGAIEDSRSYYLLSYALAPDDRKPGWRKIKVEVAAQSVQVRAREGFYDGPAVILDKPAKLHADEIDALASPLAASGVLMNVRVLPPSAKPEATVAGKITTQFLITIPLAGITVDPSLSAAVDLEVGAIALDKHLKEAGEFLHPVRGNPKPEALKQFPQQGVRLQEKLDLPPGAYDLRFVVRDNPTGKIGTVVFPLEVK